VVFLFNVFNCYNPLLKYIQIFLQLPVFYSLRNLMFFKGLFRDIWLFKQIRFITKISTKLQTFVFLRLLNCCNPLLMYIQTFFPMSSFLLHNQFNIFSYYIFSKGKVKVKKKVKKNGIGLYSPYRRCWSPFLGPSARKCNWGLGANHHVLSHILPSYLPRYLPVPI
jgi:hypothetical protein